MNIEYKNIKEEISALGMTQKQVADLMGISLQGLEYRIAQNKPTLHWAMFGIVNYFSNFDDDLIKEMQQMDIKTIHELGFEMSSQRTHSVAKV